MLQKFDFFEKKNEKIKWFEIITQRNRNLIKDKAFCNFTELRLIYFI